MPAPPTKTKKFESLTKFLQKRFKNVPSPTPRPLLDCLIYAALLENAAFEQADQAFTALEHYYIDWNEMRVSTVSELADVIPTLTDPLSAARRVRQTLQGVFDKSYSFDIEELRKKGKNLSNSCAFLESIRGCTPFMVAYAVQTALDGHLIPLDEAALRVFRLLGMAQVSKDGTKEEVAGLERAVTKKIGLTFAAQLHHFAAAYFNDPESAELRTLLKSIDPEAVKRSWLPPVLTVSKELSGKEKMPKPPEVGFNNSGDSPKDKVFVEEKIVEETGKESGNLKPEKDVPKPIKTEPPQKDAKPVIKKPEVKTPSPSVNLPADKKDVPKQSKKPQSDAPPKSAPKQTSKQTPKSPTHQLRSKKPK